MVKLLLLGFLVNIAGILCAMDVREQNAAAKVLQDAAVIALQGRAGRSGSQPQLDPKGSVGRELKDTPRTSRSIGSQLSPRVSHQGESKDTPRSIGSQLSPHTSRQDDLKDTPRTHGSQLSPLMSYRVNNWLSYWIEFCERMSVDTNAEINRGQMGDGGNKSLHVDVDIEQKMEMFKAIEAIMGAPMPILSGEVKKHLESIKESGRAKKKDRSNINRTTLDRLPEKDESGLSELEEEEVEEDAVSRSSQGSTLQRQSHPISAQQAGVPALNLAGTKSLDYLFEKNCKG